MSILDGVTVLALEQAVAAPFATRTAERAVQIEEEDILIFTSFVALNYISRQTGGR